MRGCGRRRCGEGGARRRGDWRNDAKEIECCVRRHSSFLSGCAPKNQAHTMAGFLRHWMHRVRVCECVRRPRALATAAGEGREGKGARMGVQSRGRVARLPATLPRAPSCVCTNCRVCMKTRASTARWGGEAAYTHTNARKHSLLRPHTLPTPTQQEPIIVWSFIIGGIGLALPIVVPPLRDATAPGARAQPPPVRDLVARASAGGQ